MPNKASAEWGKCLSGCRGESQSDRQYRWRRDALPTRGWGDWSRAASLSF